MSYRARPGAIFSIGMSSSRNSAAAVSAVALGFKASTFRGMTGAVKGDVTWRPLIRAQKNNMLPSFGGRGRQPFQRKADQFHKPYSRHCEPIGRAYARSIERSNPSPPQKKSWTCLRARAPEFRLPGQGGFESRKRSSDRFTDLAILLDPANRSDHRRGRSARTSALTSIILHQAGRWPGDQHRSKDRPLDVSLAVRSG
jgi:hypothetical protein